MYILAFSSKSNSKLLNEIFMFLLFNHIFKMHHFIRVMHHLKASRQHFLLEIGGDGGVSN